MQVYINNVILQERAGKKYDKVEMYYCINIENIDNSMLINGIKWCIIKQKT